MSDKHHDRTVKQPLVWRCMNPECIVDGKRFEFVSDQPSCPRCTDSGHPYVLLVALIHYLVRSDRGLIVGKHGRYNIACDPTRGPYVASLTNSEAATERQSLVNCPGCLQKLQRGAA